MRQNLIAILALIIFPSCIFAFPVGGYFQQSMHITNDATHSILITDPSRETITNLEIVPGEYFQVNFASDQLTSGDGQTFSHLVNIYTAAEHKLICTVTSNLFLSPTQELNNKPTVTGDESSKCTTGTYVSFGQSGVLYGFSVSVKD